MNCETITAYTQECKPITGQLKTILIKAEPEIKKEKTFKQYYMHEIASNLKQLKPLQNQNQKEKPKALDAFTQLPINIQIESRKRFAKFKKNYKHLSDEQILKKVAAHFGIALTK